jgi:predicted AAA+ superfamily ATPase
MQIFRRQLDLPSLLEKKSHFLFGPRGTGKSYLIRHSFPKEVLVINLLKSEEFLDLHLQPHRLRDRIDPQKDRIVIIDEVQKIPKLLDEVHYLIEEHKINFLLTGSSVRRLKAQDANMLGGRARRAELFPVGYSEINRFNLDPYLRFGGLPAILNSTDPKEDLSAYVHNYLNEEIKLEANIRKIDFFHRFLEMAALGSCEIINYANIARDTGVSEPTVKSYYQVLEDSLIGFQLFPWRKGKSRKSVASSKFYFFDTGVMHTILRSSTTLDRNSDLYGKSFEQFMAQEIRAYISYRRLDIPLHFWRSLDKVEVDFVINNEIAIEVKSTRKTRPENLKGLKAIQDEGKLKKRLFVSQDPVRKSIDGVTLIDWREFLDQLWSDRII